MATVSIAMCTYNGARFLKEQLESIAAQTRLPNQLVICDDDSSDNTGAIVNHFSQSAPLKVCFVRNELRLGSTRNFEKAIQLCSGDLIALCDQDDIWSPRKLELQAAALESDRTLGGLFSNASIIDDESSPKDFTLWDANRFTSRERERFRRGKALDTLLTMDKVYGCTLMFRSHHRDRICPIPATWSHDTWISCILAIYSEIDFISEPLTDYRIHSAQQFGAHRQNLLRQMRRARNTGSKEYSFAIDQLTDLHASLIAHEDTCTHDARSYILKRIAHLRVRATLPENRWLRLRLVLGDTRNYRQFSRGLRSMIKDVVF